MKFKMNSFENPLSKIMPVLGDSLINFDFLVKHYLLKLKLTSVIDSNSAV